MDKRLEHWYAKADAFMEKATWVTLAVFVLYLGIHIIVAIAKGRF